MQSNLDIQREKIYEYLQKKYKRAVISKNEMANELGVSNSTLIYILQKEVDYPIIKNWVMQKMRKLYLQLWLN